VIEPHFDYWSRTPYASRGAKKVASGFRYSSDGNTEWLNPAQIRDLIAYTVASKA
jgi:hypothetical protein